VQNYVVEPLSGRAYVWTQRYPSADHAFTDTNGNADLIKPVSVDSSKTIRYDGYFTCDFSPQVWVNSVAKNSILMQES